LEENLPENLTKIVFDDGSGNAEGLWGEPISGDTFLLWNTPFFHYGVSYGDVVLASYRNDEERPTFERVVEKRGHRTIRFLMFGEHWEKAEQAGVLDKMNALGAHYKGLYGRLVSLDIPREANFEAIWKELERRGIEFEFADPTHDVLFPS
jgi:hypothetical protein